MKPDQASQNANYARIKKINMVHDDLRRSNRDESQGQDCQQRIEKDLDGAHFETFRKMKYVTFMQAQFEVTFIQVIWGGQ